MKMKESDTETTVTIDIDRFPEEYRTGEGNPFMRVDEHQLDDVESWVRSLLPCDCSGDMEYCAELIGQIPVVVALRIGDVLGETGCQKLKYVYPGKYVAVIWDFTSLPEGTVDEAARKEVLERVGCKPEASADEDGAMC
jgi:hypothetical protein